MSTIKVNTITNNGSAVDLPAGVFTINGNGIIQNYTSSATEPSSPSAGDIWWDSANNTYYVYINSEFKEIGIIIPRAWYGDRAVYIGGVNISSSTIKYYDITTPGNASLFGNTVDIPYENAAVSNGTFVVFMKANATLHYITTATLGNAQSFGTNTYGQNHASACGDGVYGLIAGGNGELNNISRFVMETPGDSTDFGDLTVGRGHLAAVGGTTRGVFVGGGGNGGVSNGSNIIDYVTIATPSNATDFGDLGIANWNYMAACSDDTRGVIGGGSGDSETNTIEYITVNTTGNSTDFGDLTVSRRNLVSSGSSVYACFSGGYTGYSVSNVIDRITIQTTGNATDHGDLNGPEYSGAASSGSAA